MNAAIKQADVLLVATGAGWSADSGLAIYRDVADVAAYHERGLTYRDICTPQWLEEDPGLFYGFWGGCYNDYRNVGPHEGYGIVRRWVEEGFKDTEAAATMRQHARAGEESGVASSSQVAGAFYSYTSNVDAHWHRHCREGEVYECHGNSEWWQCARKDCTHAGDDHDIRGVRGAGF